MTSQTRLLLVNDQTLYRRCLSAYLNRRRDLLVVAEAAGASQAVHAARTLQPDVVVTDFLPTSAGSTLIADLRQSVPTIMVLVLTASTEARVVAAAMRAGARAYLHTSCEPDELVMAIKRIQAGELVVAVKAVEAVIESLTTTQANGHETIRAELTEREREVLRLVALGRTNAEIGRELSITEYTVKGHLAKLLDKLALDNRVQLATYAVQHGGHRDGELTDSVWPAVLSRGEPPLALAPIR